ncbi:hypothetical protein DCAR_0625537 [Daucus carota subsp. sativus]|uniref:Carbonic anhydrase n=1 Tax=Daucus carota subsp. sativus TaxID=79200 RepID=A0AAF0XFZ7_DAUCS|nr:PREDICTED: alpha carbonic anhydrase 7-like [Daucus carota subsp. sativus]WOH06114.1 hypothetical protein DCAR_0625537 [Daucus carota subsp. sativus]
MKIKCSITLFPSLLLLFFYVTSLVIAQELEHEEEFEYKDHSPKAPKLWGELKKEWEACKALGNHTQSPIDISYEYVEVIPKSEDVITEYKSAEAEIRNRGHDIAVYWTVDPGPGFIKIDGIDYGLKLCHWHSPSEHAINGQRYDMELHMVHMTKDHKIAVVAQLYKIGKPDSFLSKLSKEMQVLQDKHGNTTVGKLDPKEIDLAGKNYYRYMGSLTTPPCTEGVTWIVNRGYCTVSQDQVKLLRHAVHDFADENARPLQALNGRKIQLYHQEAKGRNIS